MAARKRRGTIDNPWADNVRGKIQTSLLINRLHDHALGKVELSPTQIQSIKILIGKTLPDLSEANLHHEDRRTVAQFSDDELTAILRGRMRRAESDEQRPDDATVN